MYIQNYVLKLQNVLYSNNYLYCKDTFHGERPFSEAESQAIRDSLKKVMADHNKEIVYVSVHAFSQLWMFPNGYTKGLSKHHSDLKRVSNKAVEALR